MNRAQDITLASDMRAALSRLLRQFRRQVVPYQVSVTEHTTLALLDQHKQLLPSELAAMEKVTAQAMSQILNNLEAQGYIKRTPLEDDKRKVQVSLSKEGARVLAEIRNIRAEWLARAMGALLNADEKKVLKQAAGIIQRLADYDENA